MKITNSREIPNIVGEYTNQNCINKLVELLDEVANAFSTTVDGDTLALTGLGVNGASTFTLGAADTITVDAGTTDHTGANVITMDVDANSANVKGINMDLDVGTALSTGESLTGLYIDIDGAAGDHANSILNGISMTSANTSGSSYNSAIRLAGTWDTLVYSLAASTTGIGLAGNHTNAIYINGTNTTAIGVAGTITKGLDFTAATPVYAAYSTAGTGCRNTPFVKIGSWDDPLTITQTSDHWVPIQVNVKKSGNIAFDTAAARFRVDTNGAQATSAVGCLQLRQNLGHNLASSAILNASVNVSAAVTVGSGSLLGGYFSIEGSGAITKAGDNDCTPLVAVNNNTGGGVDNVFIAMQNGTGTTVSEIVKICTTNGTSTVGLAFEGAMGKGINFAGATLANTDADDAFVAVGTWNDAYVVPAQGAHYVPIQVHLHSANSAAYDIAAARLRVDTAAANTANAVGCLQLRQSLAHNLASSAILNASVSVDGAVAVQTGSLLGGYFSIEGTGAVTKAGDNDITVLEAVCNNTGGGIDNVFLALMNGTGRNVDEIVKIAVTNGTATTGIRFEGLTDQIIIAGTSSTALVCDDADVKFIQIYADCGASSGDNRGIYNRLYLTGTGGGESLRTYTDVSGTVGTAHGAHISLGFGESTSTGAVTGLGAACRVTLGLANIAYPATGTLGVIDAEIYSFGANSDPAGNAIAILRAGNNGDSGGQADVDDDAVLIAFDGWTSADGNMLVKAGTPGAMGNATWSVRCKMPDGSLAYLNFTAAPVSA